MPQCPSAGYERHQISTTFSSSSHHSMGSPLIAKPGKISSPAIVWFIFNSPKLNIPGSLSDHPTHPGWTVGQSRSVPVHHVPALAKRWQNFSLWMKCPPKKSEHTRVCGKTGLKIQPGWRIQFPIVYSWNGLSKDISLGADGEKNGRNKYAGFGAGHWILMLLLCGAGPQD